VRFDVPDEITGVCPFVHRRIIGGLTGLLTGGPSGALAGIIGGGSRPPPSRPPRPSRGAIVTGPAGGPERPQSIPARRQLTGNVPVRFNPRDVLPGGPPALTVAGGGEMTQGATAVSGFHLNKSSYFLIDGTHVPKGSRWVKNRRRNALNPSALRRAVSRINAGKIWQSKLAEISTGKFTSAGKKKHH